ILHGVGDGGRRRDGGVLANAFGLVRPRAVFAFDQYGCELWDIDNAGNFVFAETGSGYLALIVEQLLHQTGADRHDRLTVDLTLVSKWVDDRADVVRSDKFV